VPEVHVASTQPIIAPKRASGRLPSDGPQPKRVLVVDDDLTVRLYLRARLMLRGHLQLLEASDGAEALELVMTQRFDVLLLDVDMGAQNGYEVCRAVRAHVRSEGGKQPRIYMITGRSSMLDKMRAKMAGADAFLSKPPHPGELAELLAQL
jgi:CheY-like chemotaxis protein